MRWEPIETYLKAYVDRIPNGSTHFVITNPLRDLNGDIYAYIITTNRASPEPRLYCFQKYTTAPKITGVWDFERFETREDMERFFKNLYERKLRQGCKMMADGLFDMS